jgi:hypothetical protein
VAIDVFSRFAHTFPLRSTRGKEISSVLQTLFRRDEKPTKLRIDKGVEFRNRDVQRLLKAERVDHFYTQNEQKSSYAERCIKTLKSKLFRYLSRHQTHRWIDVLDEVTQSYNGSYHRSIKGDQERRSPIVKTPVRHQTVYQGIDATLRVPERRHRPHLARETTVRSGIRRTMDDGIFRGGRSRHEGRHTLLHVKGYVR